MPVQSHVVVTVLIASNACVSPIVALLFSVRRSRFSSTARLRFPSPQQQVSICTHFALALGVNHISSKAAFVGLAMCTLCQMGGFRRPVSTGNWPMTIGFERRNYIDKKVMTGPGRREGGKRCQSLLMLETRFGMPYLFLF